MSQFKSDDRSTMPISIPDQYINVKTGEKHAVSGKIRDEIEYHSRNRTLVHLVMSALHEYLETPKRVDGASEVILRELEEIKQLMKNGVTFHSPSSSIASPMKMTTQVDRNEVDDILEAFGG